MKNNITQKQFPHIFSEHRDEIEIYLKNIENDNWLDIHDRLEVEYKLKPEEDSKIEKLLEHSLGKIGKDGSQYNLTHSEIVFFLYKTWKSISEDNILWNKLKELNYYKNQIDLSLENFKLKR